MTMKLRLLVRVVRRRLEGGEELGAVLKDYPRLTEAEKKALQGALKG